MKTFTIEIPIYNQRVVCCKGEFNYSKFKKELAKARLKLPEDEDYRQETEDFIGTVSGAAFNFAPSGVYAIWISEEDTATIVHEVTHVTKYLGRAIGLPESQDTDEFYSYLNGWLVDEFIQRIK